MAAQAGLSKGDLEQGIGAVPPYIVHADADANTLWRAGRNLHSRSVEGDTLYRNATINRGRGPNTSKEQNFGWRSESDAMVATQMPTNFTHFQGLFGHM